jgi:hypothetical protein
MKISKQEQAKTRAKLIETAIDLMIKKDLKNESK